MKLMIMQDGLFSQSGQHQHCSDLDPATRMRTSGQTLTITKAISFLSLPSNPCPARQSNRPQQSQTVPPGRHLPHLSYRLRIHRPHRPFIQPLHLPQIPYLKLCTIVVIIFATLFFLSGIAEHIQTSKSIRTPTMTDSTITVMRTFGVTVDGLSTVG